MNKERKYILIGGAILLLIGAIYRFFPEIEAFQPSGEEIVLKQKKLIKYRQTVEERSQTDAKLIALNRSLERSEAGLLNGETPALAAVDIQNILNQIASKSKVEVKAMRVLEPAEPAVQGNSLRYRNLVKTFKNNGNENHRRKKQTSGTDIFEPCGRRLYEL